jgi:hypothetical protein
MPQYFFTIHAGHEGAQAERAAELSDDAAALAYASKLARELCNATSAPTPAGS